MMVPPWALGVMLAFALGQFGLVAAWMLRADRRLALMEQTLESIAKQLENNNLAVLTQRVNALELASKDHKAGHDRNRDRIGQLHTDLARELDRAKDDIMARLTHKPTPRSMHGE